MKWFNLLTNEELLNFWKTQDSKIEDKIKREYDGECAWVWFWELGWGKTKKEQKTGIPTRYKFEDFSVEFWETYAPEEEELDVRAGYIEFMAERFGKPYIADFLNYKTGIPAENWLGYMAKGERDGN